MPILLVAYTKDIIFNGMKLLMLVTFYELHKWTFILTLNTY